MVIEYPSYPCKCGHEREVHWAINSTGCAAVIKVENITHISTPTEVIVTCRCKEYQRDNLKYLEQLA